MLIAIGIIHNISALVNTYAESSNLIR